MQQYEQSVKFNTLQESPSMTVTLHKLSRQLIPKKLKVQQAEADLKKNFFQT